MMLFPSVAYPFRLTTKRAAAAIHVERSPQCVTLAFTSDFELVVVLSKTIIHERENKCKRGLKDAAATTFNIIMDTITVRDSIVGEVALVQQALFIIHLTDHCARGVEPVGDETCRHIVCVASKKMK